MYMNKTFEKCLWIKYENIGQCMVMIYEYIKYTSVVYEKYINTIYVYGQHKVMVYGQHMKIAYN
jgi:hypothetical protein